MAIREYSCPRCDRVKEELFNGDFPKKIKCECGGMMNYKIGAPIFKIMFRDGYDWGSGEYYNSQKERDNDIAKKGLRLIKD